MDNKRLELEEDTLLDAWDLEYSLWIRNGPAYKAYTHFMAEKKRKKLEASGQLLNWELLI